MNPFKRLRRFAAVELVTDLLALKPLGGVGSLVFRRITYGQHGFDSQVGRNFEPFGNIILRRPAVGMHPGADLDPAASQAQ